MQVALVLVLVVLAAVAAALAIERTVRTRGLELARRRLATELGTDAVRLTVPARSLVPALLRRSGTPVEVHADDVRVGDGARLRTLRATLSAVRADLRGRALGTGPGTFTATIDERELADLVRLPGVVSRLELGATGLRVWTVLGVGLDADVLVHDGALRVIPDPVQLAPLLQLPGVGAFRRAIEGRGLRFELPPLPFDATVETVAVEVGAVVATGRIPPQRLPLHGSGVRHGRQRRR